MSELSELDAKPAKLVEYVAFGVFNARGILMHTGTCERDNLGAVELKDGETIQEGNFEWKRSPLRPTYRLARKQEYPSLHEQLGAACKMAKALRDAGIDLPPDVWKWIDDVDAVKAKYPKDAD